MPGLRALQSIRQPGAGALLILDRAQHVDFSQLAAPPWRLDRRLAGLELRRAGKPSMAQWSYGHRMLWVKRLFPEAAFMPPYFDPDDPDAA